MKKTLSLIVAILIMMQMIAFCGTVSALESPTLMVSSAEGYAGQKVEITVAIANNTGFSGVEFNLNYDKDVLTYVSGTFSEAVSSKFYDPESGADFDSEQHILGEMLADESGYVHVGVVGITNLTGDMDIATFTFEIKSETAGVSNITIDNYEASYVVDDDANINDLALEVTSGAVTVTEKPAYTIGDVDGNGRINMLDVNMIRRYLINATLYPMTVPEAADADGNGRVNMLDVNKIRRYLINSTLYPLT